MATLVFTVALNTDTKEAQFVGNIDEITALKIMSDAVTASINQKLMPAPKETEK